MSALLTHAAVGLLLGLALRLRLRYLPVAAFLAIAPDLDHLGDFLPIPFLESRVTFTNVFVCLLLPLVVYAVAHYRGWPAEWRRLAGAAPLFLVGHILLDVLPLEPLGTTGKVALLWPLSDAWFTLADIRVTRIDPREYSFFTVILLSLTAMTLLTLLAVETLEGARARSRRQRLAGVGAFSAAWLLLFPALVAGGFMIYAPARPDARLFVEHAELEAPEGRLAAVVLHGGGEPAPAGSLNLSVLVDGRRMAALTNPVELRVGDRWRVEFGVLAGQLPTAPVDVRLAGNSELDRRPFMTAPVAIRLGHAEASLELVAFSIDAPGQATATLANRGGDPVPAGTVAIRVLRADGTALVDEINARPLGVGGTWSVPVRLGGPALLDPLVLEARAVGDGHIYLSTPLDVAA